MESNECPETQVDDRALKSLLSHLRTEFGVLDRMVYKNKNQHRRCHYFHSLLKVRRDVRLLLSAKPEEILSSAFEVIRGRNPSQRIFLLERLKNSASCGENNFHKRLLGVARLLSQMVEPILIAAGGSLVIRLVTFIAALSFFNFVLEFLQNNLEYTSHADSFTFLSQISSLLAKSFFMGFSLTILSLLARLRVLVQQMLVECVSVFNKVTTISRERHSIKLTKNGIEAFREYYPPSGPVISLECAWESDKFVLLERQYFSNGEESHLEIDVPDMPDVRYEVVGFGSEGENASDGHNAGNIPVRPQEQSICQIDSQTVEQSKLIDGLGLKRKVAFVSVTASSRTSEASKPNREKMPKFDDMASCNSGASDTQDPFFSLLVAGNVKGGLFGS